MPTQGGISGIQVYQNKRNRKKLLMTVKLVSSLNPACFRPVSLIGRSIQVCSGRQLEMSQTHVGFREGGGGGGAPTAPRQMMTDLPRR